MGTNWVLPSGGCLLLAWVTACGGDDGGGAADANGGGDSFAGQTYLLSIGAGDWGPGIGQALDAEAVPEFALEVDGAPEAYDVTIGTGYIPEEGGAWQQELCNPTSHWPAKSDPYPGFALGPIDLPMYFRHPIQEASAKATAYQFSMTNLLLPEGVSATSGTLSAIVDAREIYPVFPQLGPGANQDDLCAYVLNNDIDTCKPCPGAPDQVYCLTLTASYLGAPAAAVTLQETPGYADACFFN